VYVGQVFLLCRHCGGQLWQLVDDDIGRCPRQARQPDCATGLYLTVTVMTAPYVGSTMGVQTSSCQTGSA